MCRPLQETQNNGLWNFFLGGGGGANRVNNGKLEIRELNEKKKTKMSQKIHSVFFVNSG